MNFDVIIIGGGPGGVQAAKVLAHAGKKVALIEQHLVGGECLHVGCIPSKVYLHTSELFEKAKKMADFGLEVGEVKLNFPKLVERRKKVVDMIHRGLKFSLEKMGVQIFQAKGQMIDANTVKAGGETLTAPYIILATGSEPMMLPGLQPSPRILTNRTVFELMEQPKSIIIVGGGAIGSEFASFFGAIGTQVTLVERMDRILSLEDEEISAELLKMLGRRDVKVLTGTSIANLLDKGDHVEADGITADYALIAIGRKVTGNIPLQPNVYAIGDFAKKAMFAYTAEREGEVAARNILGEKIAMDYHTFPSTIFTHPEIASIGLHENQVQNPLVGKSTYAENSKALIEGDRDGFAKVIVDRASGVIVGVHIIGKNATLLIDKATLAVAEKMKPEQFLRSLHGHPVVSEVLKEAVFRAQS